MELTTEEIHSIYRCLHRGMQNSHGALKDHFPLGNIPPRLVILAFPKTVLGSKKHWWTYLSSGGGSNVFRQQLGFEAVAGTNYPLMDVSFPSHILGVPAQLRGVLAVDEAREVAFRGGLAFGPNVMELARIRQEEEEEEEEEENKEEDEAAPARARVRRSRGFSVYSTLRKLREAVAKDSEENKWDRKLEKRFSTLKEYELNGLLDLR